MVLTTAVPHLAAIGPVTVDAQARAVALMAAVAGDLVEARPPHSRLAACRDDLTIAWATSEQHIHRLTVRTCRRFESGVGAFASPGAAVHQRPSIAAETILSLSRAVRTWSLRAPRA